MDGEGSSGGVGALHDARVTSRSTSAVIYILVELVLQ
jgi:hypothetical protein